MNNTQNFLKIFNQEGENIFQIDEIKKHQLSRYYELLNKWKNMHNLTSINNVEQVVVKHFIDCIVGLLLIPENKEIYDLGTGAGFPGLVAAILQPNNKFILVDSVRKKCSFLLTAVAELSLKNVEVVNKRIEEMLPVKVAMTRAAFSNETFSLLKDVISAHGTLYAFVGPSTIEQLENNFSFDGFELESLKKYSLKNATQRAVAILRRT